MNDRKATFAAIALALAGGCTAGVIPVTAGGYGQPFASLVPDPLHGYGIAGALQHMPVDNLFAVARGLAPATNTPTGPWLKYQALAEVEVAEPTDAEVLAALAEVEEANHQQLVAEAYAERLSGRHTLH